MKLLIMQLIILVFLLIAIIVFLRENRAYKKEERISRYAINPITKHDDSIFDTLFNKYLDLVKRLRFIEKVYLFKLIAGMYEKYVSYGEKEKTQAIDYVIHKLFISLLFVTITVVSLAVQGKVANVIQIVLSFIVGFFILDLYLIISKRRRVKKIENQMLRAVIIMNNAFKAGKSTIQAVEIASLELEEPLSQEFKKIYLDMKYGLEIDAVFERFARRINIPSARYISSSLTILNKTGGNIVNVFSSIERTLFDKKKLEEDLKNSTASSKLVVIILALMPIVLVSVIASLNKEYFNPLFSSFLGYIILSLIILIFVGYIYALIRVAKVVIINEK